jgi:hypothetical protein
MYEQENATIGRDTLSSGISIQAETKGAEKNVPTCDVGSGLQRILWHIFTVAEYLAQRGASSRYYLVDGALAAWENGAGDAKGATAP